MEHKSFFLIKNIFYFILTMYSPVCPGCETCPYSTPPSSSVKPIELKYGTVIINLVRPNHHRVDVYAIPRVVLSPRDEGFLENTLGQPVWERYYLWAALGYAKEPFLRQHWKKNPYLSYKECIEALGLWGPYRMDLDRFEEQDSISKIFNVFGAHKK
jgi:hypothetical protein